MIDEDAQLTAADRPEAEARRRPMWALGLMSGTSMDGVDAALVLTDGLAVARTGPSLTRAYDGPTRAALAAAVARPDDTALVDAAARGITEVHRAACRALMAEASVAPDLVGFHGHTLWHRPDRGATRQIGDGAALARALGIAVVDDFRSADMAAGGQGAPLAPLYHLARIDGGTLARPVAVLNLGGVANVTWIGAGGGDAPILAFDTGPGCALIDDWVRVATGADFDEDGALAAAGRVDRARLARLGTGGYFDRVPPKSLDRFDFSADAVAGLSPADGAATLTAFTAECVARARAHFPTPARRWYATGGGRRNQALMAALAEALGMAVEPVEALGWNGDSLEAEAFAFLAVRSLRGLPLSLPATTGAARAVTGGRLHRP